jgi:hypothetical protein
VIPGSKVFAIVSRISFRSVLTTCQSVFGKVKSFAGYEFPESAIREPGSLSGMKVNSGSES